MFLSYFNQTDLKNYYIKIKSCALQDDSEGINNNQNNSNKFSHFSLGLSASIKNKLLCIIDKHLSKTTSIADEDLSFSLNK